MASFQAATCAYLFLMFLNTTRTVGLDHHLYCCVQSAHSELSLRVPMHTHPPGSREDGAPRVVGVGGQQLPFVHKGHSYVTCFKQGSLCICVCVLSTICDQFNGNFIYLKKKHK